jgi:hypothetical protein
MALRSTLRRTGEIRPDRIRESESSCSTSSDRRRDSRWIIRRWSEPPGERHPPDQVREADDRGERGLELVRDHVHELVLALIDEPQVLVLLLEPRLVDDPLHELGVADRDGRLRGDRRDHAHRLLVVGVRARVLDGHDAEDLVAGDQRHAEP